MIINLEKIFNSLKSSPSYEMKIYVLDSFLPQLREYTEYNLYILRNVYDLLTSKDSDNRKIGSKILKAVNIQINIKNENKEINLNNTNIFLSNRDFKDMKKTVAKAEIKKKLKLDHVEDTFLDEVIKSTEKKRETRFNTPSTKKIEIKREEDFYANLMQMTLSPEWEIREGMFLGLKSILSKKKIKTGDSNKEIINEKYIEGKISKIEINEEKEVLNNNTSSSIVNNSTSSSIVNNSTSSSIVNNNTSSSTSIPNISSTSSNSVPNNSSILNTSTSVPNISSIPNTTSIPNTSIVNNNNTTSIPNTTSVLNNSSIPIKNFSSIKIITLSLNLIIKNLLVILSNDKFYDFSTHKAKAPVRDVASLLIPKILKFHTHFFLIEKITSLIFSSDFHLNLTALVCIKTMLRRHRALKRENKAFLLRKLQNREILLKIVEMLNNTDDDVKYIAAEIIKKIIKMSYRDKDIQNISILIDLQSLLDTLVSLINNTSSISVSAFVSLINLILKIEPSLSFDTSVLNSLFISPIKEIRLNVLKISRRLEDEDVLYLLAENILLLNDSLAHRILRKKTVNLSFITHFFKIITEDITLPYREIDFACYKEDYFTEQGVKALGIENIMDKRIALFRVLRKDLEKEKIENKGDLLLFNTFINLSETNKGNKSSDNKGNKSINKSSDNTSILNNNNTSINITTLNNNNKSSDTNINTSINTTTLNNNNNTSILNNNNNTSILNNNNTSILNNNNTSIINNNNITTLNNINNNFIKFVLFSLKKDIHVYPFLKGIPLKELVTLLKNPLAQGYSPVRETLIRYLRYLLSTLQGAQHSFVSYVLLENTTAFLRLYFPLLFNSPTTEDCFLFFVKIAGGQAQGLLKNLGVFFKRLGPRLFREPFFLEKYRALLSLYRDKPVVVYKEDMGMVYGAEEGDVLGYTKDIPPTKKDYDPSLIIFLSALAHVYNKEKEVLNIFIIAFINSYLGIDLWYSIKILRALLKDLKYNSLFIKLVLMNKINENTLKMISELINEIEGSYKIILLDLIIKEYNNKSTDKNFDNDNKYIDNKYIDNKIDNKYIDKNFDKNFDKSNDKYIDNKIDNKNFDNKIDKNFDNKNFDNINLPSLISSIIPSLVLHPKPNLDKYLLFLIEREKKRIEMILDPSRIPQVCPTPRLTVPLRNYQLQGVKWLSFINSFGFNGILADDMGLGKTLQVLTHIFTQLSDKQGSVLILSPRSLVDHWYQEILSKFSLAKNTLISKVSCNLNSPKQGKLTFYLCSYETLRKISIGFSFLYFVCDEAHLLKNKNTVLYSKILLVKANHKILLTGTPISNSVEDIFSLFKIIMPNYLGSEKAYRAKYKINIKQFNSNRKSSKFSEFQKNVKSLHKKILPFIMRRLKCDVLKELPEKIIKDFTIELSKDQREIYCKIENSEVSEKDPQSKNGLFKENEHPLRKIKLLLKACAHPLYFDLKAQSSKTEALKDILNMSTINRVLVFFQYKKTLEFVVNEIFEENAYADFVREANNGVFLGSRKFFVLNGEIKNKFDVVKGFSDSAVPYFFLTTNVGGLGLNLTCANTVVFYEHDWNPFNDLQAMDRTHRLGQEKTVNVFRLIAKNTIEEKIMNYQNFKTFISSNIISQQNNKIESMETKDLFEKIIE